MTKMRLLLAVCLTAVVALTAGAAFAAAPLASANGHGSLDNNTRQFSFRAKENADGTVTGQAELVNQAFSGANGHSPYQLHVDISCLKVVGNTAIFGGTVKR